MHWENITYIHTSFVIAYHYELTLTENIFTIDFTILLLCTIIRSNTSRK